MAKSARADFILLLPKNYLGTFWCVNCLITWLDVSMETNFWQVVLSKLGVFQLNFQCLWDFVFLLRITPKIFTASTSLYFSRFFQNKFGDFLTLPKIFEIQDGGSKMADFFKRMMIWRHNLHVTVTKIFFLDALHISFISIARILLEIHGGIVCPRPRLTNEKKAQAE